MIDYYKTLKIDCTADINAIKKSYRKLAFYYHPDKNKSINASRNFIEITEAYEVLVNPLKRQEYDNYYHKNHQKHINEPFNKNLIEWSQMGKDKAAIFLTMTYEEFKKVLIFELRLGLNYIPSLIIIFLIFIGIIGLFEIAFKLMNDSNSNIGLFIFIIVGLIYVLFRLIKVTYSDYVKDRYSNSY